MANPRKIYSWNRLHPFDATFPADGTITLPVVGAQGMVPTLSPQVGMAVAITATGTNTPQVGLGAAGNECLGKLMAVEADGSCTVQVGGVMYLPYATGTPPVPGAYVTVDGTGKVQAAGSVATTPAVPRLTRAFCLGFDLDPEPLFSSTPALLAVIQVG